MMWILLGLLLILAIGASTVAFRVVRRSRWDTPPAPRRRCLRCHGTGWLGTEPERTLTFTGDGFEDRHTAATQCPDCRGTGVR